MNLRWEELPFCLLTPEQQIQLRNQAEIGRYQTGNIIWSTDEPGSQFLIISGNVRLREEGNPKSSTLKAGDWFGDLLELSGNFKAVASSKDVEVVRWNAALWQQASSLELNSFWQQERSRYQPQDPNSPQPVSGYPFILSPNTAAACLTMAAQYLQNPIQLEFVQRQLRGQHPNDVMEAAEKLGLQLRQLQVTWNDLRSLSFPALLLWQPPLHPPLSKGRAVSFAQLRILSRVSARNFRESAIEKLLLQRVNLSAIRSASSQRLIARLMSK